MYTLKISTYFILMLAALSPIVQAQYVENGSFEGITGISRSPQGWYGCNQRSTPDTGPNESIDVLNAPSDGQSYLHMVLRGPEENPPIPHEDAGTQLLTPLERGKKYVLSIDLAYCEDEITTISPGVVYDYSNPVRLKIYGSTQACTKSTLITETNPIDHGDWKQYLFYFEPEDDDITYLMFEVNPIDSAIYFGNIILDNFSIAKTDCKVDTMVLMDSTVSKGSVIELNSLLSSGNNYLWRPQPGLSCTNCQSVIAEVFSSMQYQCKIINNDGCPVVQLFNIHVREQNCINETMLALDTIVEKGVTLSLWARESENRKYWWNPNDGISCDTCRTLVVNPKIPKSYTCTTILPSGCFLFQQFKIDICKSNSIIKLDTTIYQHKPVTLNSTVSFNNEYEWFPSDELSCNNCPSIQLRPEKDNVYTCRVLDSTGCSLDQRFSIQTIVPDCTSGSIITALDTTVKPGQIIQLNSVPSDNQKYTWNLNEDLSCVNCPNPTIETSYSKIYACTIEDYRGCNVDQLFIININVFIPNVITPNNDGYNDYFRVDGVRPGTKLVIMNRLGETIYEDENYNNLWAGTDKDGKALVNGTYWYIINIPEEPKNFKGYIYIKR